MLHSNRGLWVERSAWMLRLWVRECSTSVVVHRVTLKLSNTILSDIICSSSWALARASCISLRLLVSWSPWMWKVWQSKQVLFSYFKSTARWSQFALIPSFKSSICKAKEHFQDIPLITALPLLWRSLRFERCKAFLRKKRLHETGVHPSNKGAANLEFFV